LLLATALYTGRMQVGYCYLVAMAMTGLGALQGPAFIAAASTLVPRHLLVRTNSLSHTTGTTIGMVGPILAGFLIGRISYHGVILIDSCTFFIAFLSVLMVRIPRPPVTAAESRPFWHDAHIGWRYIRQRPGLLSLLTMFSISNFGLGIVQALLTPLILSFASPQELGTVQSAGAAAVLLGSLALTVWGGPRRRVWGIFGALVAQGLLLFLGGIEPSVPLVIGAVFVFMLTGPVVMSSSAAIWQSKVALDVQGRVFAIRGLIAAGTLPLAYAVAGPLADRVFEPMLRPDGLLAGTVGQVIGVGPGRGVGCLFMVLGLIILLVTALSFLNPRLRHVESELPDAPRPELPGAGAPLPAALSEAS